MALTLEQQEILFGIIELAFIESTSSTITKYCVLANIDDTFDLFVVFKTGVTYAYLNVDGNTILSFHEAESHGKFLNASIKPNYTCVKVHKTDFDQHEFVFTAPNCNRTLVSVEVAKDL